MPRNLVEWKKHCTFAGEMNEGTEKFPFFFCPMARGKIVRIK
jgi:hypothetical protein